MQNNQRLNPYFQSQPRKQSPMRQSFNFEGKRGSSYVQSKQQGFRYVKPETNLDTSAKHDYQYVAAVSADEKPKSDSTDTSGIMKRSPSFRMKSYKRPTSKKNDDQQLRNARISHLESYVQQLVETPPNQINQKPKVMAKLLSTSGTPGFGSDQSTNVTILEEQERNYEEIHYHQVEFQQRCKAMYSRIENKEK